MGEKKHTTVERSTEIQRLFLILFNFDKAAKFTSIDEIRNVQKTTAYLECQNQFTAITFENCVYNHYESISFAKKTEKQD